jgi:catechol 2,3-dioxygenase-like lactoylglutathione lyase family enzyme
MQFTLRRIILFTANLEAMASFYQSVLGLKPVHREAGWLELDAGGCAIALHAGKSTPGLQAPKLAFFATDVAAARALLIERGAKMGKLLAAGSFDMCNGKDPDGNRFQISSRA